MYIPIQEDQSRHNCNVELVHDGYSGVLAVKAGGVEVAAVVGGCQCSVVTM